MPTLKTKLRPLGHPFVLWGITLAVVVGVAFSKSNTAGGLIGGAAVASVLLTNHFHVERGRRESAQRFVAEFYGDGFLAHRSAVADLGELVRSDQEPDAGFADLAKGYWFPGVADPYIGRTVDGLNLHQHLELYLGFLTRVGQALQSGDVNDRDLSPLQDGMKRDMWLLAGLVDQVTSQSRAAKAALPQWVISVREVMKRLALQEASKSKPAGWQVRHTPTDEERRLEAIWSSTDLSVSRSRCAELAYQWEAGSTSGREFVDSYRTHLNSYGSAFFDDRRHVGQVGSFFADINLSLERKSVDLSYVIQRFGASHFEWFRGFFQAIAMESDAHSGDKRRIGWMQEVQALGVKLDKARQVKGSEKPEPLRSGQKRPLTFFTLLQPR